MTGAEEPADLMAALAAVPDPRSRRGIRHRLVSVLALAVCAVLAEAQLRGFRRMGSRLAAGGTGFASGWPSAGPPRASPTIGRLLQKIDPQALDRVVSNWLISRPASPGPPSPSAEPVRIVTSPKSQTNCRVMPQGYRGDGKSARRGRHPDGRAVHLLAAFETGSGIVLGQSVDDGKSNENTGVTPLLDRVDIADGLDADRSSED
jgi:hypothetical protein